MVAASVVPGYSSISYLNLLKSTSSFLEFYTVETIGRYLMYFSGGIYPKWKARPIGKARLVSTLS